MDFAPLIEQDLRAFLNDVFRRVREWLDPFETALDAFAAELFSARLPANWRERWRHFVAQQAAAGFVIQPESAQQFEDWLAAWAKFCGLLPVAEPQVRSAIQVAAGGERLAAIRPPVPPPAPRAIRRVSRAISSRRLEFVRHMTRARQYLDEIPRVLEALGNKLDAARADEHVDVEAEVDQIDYLIWHYNDSLESAGEAWLRENGSGDDIRRLYEMPTPARFFLPASTDEAQEQRCLTQGLRISERLGQHDVVMNRVVFGMKVAEGAGTAAGIALGGGIVVAAYKKAGAWGVTKAVAVMGAGMVADQAAEAGLRAVGASEETIKGVRLAAAVVTFIIAKRKSGAVGGVRSANSTLLTAGERRVARYGHLWQKANVEKAIARPAGPNATSWRTATGKTIFENPATGRQVVIDDAGYFRIFQPKTIGSQQGQYLDMLGKVPSPARRVKGGAIKNVPLSGGDLNAETHFLIR